MEDEKIIALYWDRNEDAIRETSSKYGRLFFRIAANLLRSREDREECVNDTYLGLWNSIPKERPSAFSVFACRITRNLALKKFEYLSAAKRNPEAVCLTETVVRFGRSISFRNVSVYALMKGELRSILFRSLTSWSLLMRQPYISLREANIRQWCFRYFPDRDC